MSSDTDAWPGTCADLTCTRRTVDIGFDDVLCVGGTGVNLGESTRRGLPAPTGLVVTAESVTAAIDEQIVSSPRGRNP